MPIPLGILAASGFRPLAAGSFDLLETQVLASSAASVTFSGLSAYAADYQHLQIRMSVRSARASTADGLALRFNGDSGNNYAQHGLEGNGSSVASFAGVPRSYANAGYIIANSATANSFSGVVLDLLDPFETSKNKVTRSLHGSTGHNYVALYSSLWLNTASITSIQLLSDSGNNLAQYSRFSLYGLRKAV